MLTEPTAESYDPAPGVTMGQIRKAIPPHCFNKCVPACRRAQLGLVCEGRRVRRRPYTPPHSKQSLPSARQCRRTTRRPAVRTCNNDVAPRALPHAPCVPSQRPPEQHILTRVRNGRCTERRSAVKPSLLHWIAWIQPHGVSHAASAGGLT